MSAEEPRTARIGVISDTHGHLGAEALEALAGVDHIIHAGDIGNPSILTELEAIAPVTAVLGNGDSALAVFGLRAVERVVVAGIRFLVVHIPADVVRRQDVDVIVVGHTHRPQVRRDDGVLYVNPGSPSRSRGDGHTIALIDIVDGRADARIVPLDRA